MTDPGGGVTVADTVRWLHDEGLVRLAGVAGRRSGPVAAYTIDVSTGAVSVHPATGAGVGSDVETIDADDLPYPAGSASRLLIVGITTSQAVLVLNLAATLAFSINADRPETVARAWVTQLLLNEEITLTTNSAAVAIAASPRCRHSFIPGGGATMINVDDKQPPITTISFNSATDGPDQLDVAVDGTAELYLGTRFWQLAQIMTIDDAAWGGLLAQFDERHSEGTR
ncbi:hypothetical protein [Nocardia callitridis]|uniref:hypothetical protein n=1 Tax=Nocardia callitridis TaxID=648753 RepID=UPI0031E5E7C6